MLGEFGTADGKYSVSYITGKLCDVAEAYSNDEPVKVSITLLIASSPRLDVRVTLLGNMD